MNGREEYITREITQSKKRARSEKGGPRARGEGHEREGRLRARGEAPGTREELIILVLGRGVPSPLDVGSPDSVCLSSPKQAVASSEPNFWPHSLQIHCNGLGPKIVTLQLASSVGRLLVRQ